METIDLNYLCTVISSLSGVPIRVFENNKQTFYYSIVNLPKDPITPYKTKIFGIVDNVGYFITPNFNYYGIVNCPPHKIVIGPARQTENNEQNLKELAFRCDVPSDDIDEFVSGMKSIVRMPLNSIMQILCTMNYVLNKEKLSLEDIMIYDDEQQNIKEILEADRANQNFNSDLAEIQSQQATHNTLALEQTLVNIVRKGDTAALREWIANAPAVRGGTLASEQMRQMKNMFIVTATLVSRAAIRGGMDIEDALSLSDAYIQKCELVYSVDRITNLQYHMVLDYTERVEKLRLGKSPSKLVTDISNYVQHHLSEPVDIETLAKAMYLSRTRLSVKFKEETGMTLTDFILKEKTEEAKRLLRYTDKTLPAISAYLGFSSQSHFSRVFRKYAECSPSEYRKKYNS